MADFLQIPCLMNFATGAIHSKLGDGWSTAAFLAVAEILPREMQDQKLYQTIARQAGENIDKLVKNNRFRVLAPLNYFALSVLEGCSDVIIEGEVRIKTVEQRLQTAQERIKALEARNLFLEAYR